MIAAARAAALAASLGASAVLPTAAQVRAPEPPGPYVLDVRGVTTGLPSSGFYPPVPAGTVAPARGLGVEVGGHVYLFRVGPARAGLGAAYLVAGGTAAPPEQSASAESPAAPADLPGRVSEAGATLRMFAPQVSFNFGTTQGWSYLSAGIGTAQVRAETRGAGGRQRESGTLRMLNAGGGARWFLNDRVAVGFDLRWFRLARGGGRLPTPPVTVVAVSAGVSLR